MNPLAYHRLFASTPSGYRVTPDHEEGESDFPRDLGAFVVARRRQRLATEQRDDPLQADAILFVERIEPVAVDIEDGHERAIGGEDRDNDLGLRIRVAGD